MRVFLFLLVWAFCIWLSSMLFQYDLWVIAGKDTPWYLDICGGLICNAFVIPVAFVCWLLQVCGVPTPFLH